MGVSRMNRVHSKRNLGEVLDEIKVEVNPDAVEPVIFNNNISTATRMRLTEVVAGYKKYRILNGLN